MALSSASAEEAAALTTVEAALPTQLHRQAERLPGVKLVARAGGAAVVWLAVFVPYLSQRPLTGAGLAAITIVAAIWTAALRSAFAAGQGTVGSGLSAAIGGFTGLVAVGAIDPWLPGLHLGPVVLLGIAAGVSASACTWEWFVRQTSAGRRRVLVVGTSEVATSVAEEVGRFLRRTHLDEIPQLWNVLNGDMSIVGPRPERPEFVAMLEGAVPFWSRRLLIKPGVTGWAQIWTDCRTNCSSTADKLSYDLWYIRHRNLSVDVAVCMKTASLVLRSMVPVRLQPGRLFARLGKGAGV